jgi:hypothetical protein
MNRTGDIGIVLILVGPILLWFLGLKLLGAGAILLGGYLMVKSIIKK